MDFKPYTEVKYSQRGWITPLFGKILHLMTLPSELLSRFYWWIGAKLQIDERHRSPFMIDTMIATFVVLEVGLLLYVEYNFGVGSLYGLTLVFAIWRILDVICTAVRIILFDPYKTNVSSEYKVASTVRSIVLGFVNYLELMISFAIIYALHPQLIEHGSREVERLDPLYLSAITQMTVGYGDLQPTGWLRWLASIQAFAGLAIMSLFIARFIALLRPINVSSEE